MEQHVKWRGRAVSAVEGRMKLLNDPFQQGAPIYMDAMRSDVAK